MSYKTNKIALEENGYSILTDFYSQSEINSILSIIENSDNQGSSFLKTKDLFAIRQLINTIPQLKNHLFNQNLTELLSELFESDYFLTKAIYFDKPSESNWFVSYHQDLSISVDQKTELDGYRNWTFKKGQYGVQPPKEILEDTITVRIHLDKTDKQNGALKIIPKSHLNGVIRKQNTAIDQESELNCEVEKGGVMLMKPLIFHASNRTINKKQRRVIHLEFCNRELTEPLKWLERAEVKPAHNNVYNPLPENR